MGLASALTTALTGLTAAETQIDVIGNNLANSQTVGFKASDTVFASQFLQTLSLGSSPTENNGGVNPMQTGLGTQVAEISPDFTQGTIEISSSPSDLAIQGDGFFMVQAASGERLYTRNGILQINSENELVTVTGNRVRVPGLAPRRIAGPIELVDLTPTLLDLAGVFVPRGTTAGQSLVELMTGTEDSTDLAFFRNHKQGYLEIGVRRGTLKYHYYFGKHDPELFDLRPDPGEQNSLVPDEPPAPPEIGTLMLGMQELLEQWIQARSGTGDDFDPTLTGADSLDADTVEALRAIGYFGN